MHDKNEKHDKSIRLSIDIGMSDTGFVIVIEDERSYVTANDTTEHMNNSIDNRCQPKLHESMSIFSSLAQIFSNIWLLLIQKL